MAKNTITVRELLKNNNYPGRGIIIGMSADGENAAFAYFIMGRSENSRNRIFVEDRGEIIIYPFDESKVEDPSLIIYSPVRVLDNHIIVTNGNQTDTIYDFLEDGKTFEQALETRTFEPDEPNFTPRISGILNFEEGQKKFNYKLNILKRNPECADLCERVTYNYEPKKGVGHFIHTYKHDGNPLPTFDEAPETISIGNDFYEFAYEIWNSLDSDNRVALFVEYRSLKSGLNEHCIINRHDTDDDDYENF